MSESKVKENLAKMHLKLAENKLKEMLPDLGHMFEAWANLPGPVANVNIYYSLWQRILALETRIKELENGRN